jgi:hypothetical protein
MAHDCRNFQVTRSTHARFAVVFIAIATSLTVAACAPDAVRNNNATGFNGYLNSLKTACPNLRIGSSDVGQWIQYGSGDNDYNYWLDMTSRLYYGRVSPAEYRSAVGAQLGASSSNAAAFDCMIGALPVQRDSAPPPRGVITY